MDPAMEASRDFSVERADNSAAVKAAAIPEEEEEDGCLVESPCAAKLSRMYSRSSSSWEWWGESWESSVPSRSEGGMVLIGEEGRGREGK